MKGNLVFFDPEKAEEECRKLTTVTGYNWQYKGIYYAKNDYSPERREIGPEYLTVYVCYIPGAH